MGNIRPPVVKKGFRCFRNQQFLEFGGYNNTGTRAMSYWLPSTTSWNRSCGRGEHAQLDRKFSHPICECTMCSNFPYQKIWKGIVSSQPSDDDITETQRKGGEATYSIHALFSITEPILTLENRLFHGDLGHFRNSPHHAPTIHSRPWFSLAMGLNYNKVLVRGGERTAVSTIRHLARAFRCGRPYKATWFPLKPKLNHTIFEAQTFLGKSYPREPRISNQHCCPWRQALVLTNTKKSPDFRLTLLGSRYDRT